MSGRSYDSNREELLNKMKRYNRLEVASYATKTFYGILLATTLMSGIKQENRLNSIQILGVLAGVEGIKRGQRGIQYARKNNQNLDGLLLQ
jgi:hypothetical protein